MLMSTHDSIQILIPYVNEPKFHYYSSILYQLYKKKTSFLSQWFKT